MYKVVSVPGGFEVVFVEEEGKAPRLIPHTNALGDIVPYAHRQAAYRRCKKLNDARKGVEEQRARDGGILL